MPGKNKTQKNGFYFFMQDLMPALKREGRVLPGGMADVVPIAHPRWKQLDEKERERYENMAKEYKRRMRGQVGDAIRMDNQGQIIAHRRNEVSDYENDRKREIESLVAKWHDDGVDITQEKLYFVDVQSLCKTEDGRYLPVEMAVIEFSLKTGISTFYHTFLAPGEIPKGMRYECQSSSDDTHQIPLEGHPKATMNFLSVQNRLENLLNPQKSKSSYPPLFAMREEWDKVNFTINLIREASQLGRHAAALKVYELESLFVAITTYSGERRAPSKATAADRLSTNQYDYHPGLKCAFHEDLECKYCSLLIVRRFCYAISDNMSDLYDYELIPNQHLPAAKGAQFQVLEDDDAGWASNSKYSNWQPSNPSSTQNNIVYKEPSAVPKTQSTLLSNRVPRPAPVFRPPGAASADFGKNQTFWSANPSQPVPPPETHSAPITAAQSPNRTVQTSQSVDDLSGYDLLSSADETMPSRNCDLQSCRVSTWLPPKSRGPWSRTSTPASTPRATPMATPAMTPLATPQHSPPRPGGMFPQQGSWGRPGAGRGIMSASQPPPGFGAAPVRRPPPGFPEQSVNAGTGDYMMAPLYAGFPSLNFSVGRGGRGNAGPPL